VSWKDFTRGILAGEAIHNSAFRLRATEYDQSAMIDMLEHDDTPLLDIVLSPHRSLDPLGFLVVMIVVSIVSFAAGLFFLLKGAWPVLGFFGLDVLLIYFAFRASYRSADFYETIRLTRRELAVERRVSSGHAQRWTFQPYWLRVQVDERPFTTGSITLRSHGRMIAIGSFLSPSERSDLAKVLDDALVSARRPLSN
jgi:uncharacterized membrane protein